MAADYRVVEYRSHAPIEAIGVYSTSPLSLNIQGSGFKDVSAVHVNGEPSPEFIVLSPRRILAEVPKTQRRSEIFSVLVFTSDGDSSTAKSSILLAVSYNGNVAEGRVRMVQSFLRRFLTTPGSDIFRPGDGGGVQALIGTALYPAALKTAALTAVSETASQEIQLQSKNPRLLVSERLRSATLLLAEFQPRSGVLSLRIRLTSVDGVSSDAAITL